MSRLEALQTALANVSDALDNLASEFSDVETDAVPKEATYEESLGNLPRAVQPDREMPDLPMRW